MPESPKLILAAQGDHVPEIERRIRVIKERCRALRHSLPFNKIPMIITTYMVLHAVRMLNFFPQKTGVSETLSPKTIISGERLDWKRHRALPFGAYCQVHEQDEMGRSDINNERTLGAISIGPSDNQHSGYRFMSLQTGRKVTRTSWTELPMPRQVVERVHDLAADQPEKLVFYDRHGRAIGDSSTNIELTDDEVGLPIDDEQEEIQVAVQMQDCLLDGGLNDEEEEASLSDGAPGDGTGVEHGRDELPDRTNEILNIAESNIVTQNDGSHEQGEQAKYYP
jgi:hypothetical protein